MQMHWENQYHYCRVKFAGNHWRQCWIEMASLTPFLSGEDPFPVSHPPHISKNDWHSAFIPFCAFKTDLNFSANSLALPGIYKADLNISKFHSARHKIPSLFFLSTHDVGGTALLQADAQQNK